jgi:hypothetical protein
MCALSAPVDRCWLLVGVVQHQQWWTSARVDSWLLMQLLRDGWLASVCNYALYHTQMLFVAGFMGD